MRNTQLLCDRLEEAGYEGQINESLKAYLRDLGYDSQLAEALYYYLDDLGYEGQLSDKLRRWDEDVLSLFTPLFLFSNGEEGAFYNLSVTTSVFEDVSATNPSEHLQPIARVNDLSGNNNHATI